MLQNFQFEETSDVLAIKDMAFYFYVIQPNFRELKFGTTVACKWMNRAEELEAQFGSVFLLCTSTAGSDSLRHFENSYSIRLEWIRPSPYCATTIEVQQGGTCRESNIFQHTTDVAVTIFLQPRSETSELLIYQLHERFMHLNILLQVGRKHLIL